MLFEFFVGVICSREPKVGQSHFFFFVDRFFLCEIVPFVLQAEILAITSSEKKSLRKFILKVN